jgi:dTDP-4-dehydrorhamnose reductase
MTILVLGKTGQVARALNELLGHKVYCADRAEADFTRPELFAALIERVHPHAIINAVAYTQVDKAESEEDIAYQVNAASPAELARLAHLHNIPFVHYSTDYVFNGEGTKPFNECDETAPLNAYGRTKRAGEEAILAEGGKTMIFRTSWVFDGIGKNFLTTMLRLGRERETLSVVADQYGAPSYAPHLAHATMEALVAALHMSAFPSGIYHLCNKGETSWHGFATAIFEEAHARAIPLAVKDCLAIATKDYPTPALRPLNSRLDCTKLAETFHVTLPQWQEGLRQAMHSQ